MRTVLLTVMAMMLTGTGVRAAEADRTPVRPFDLSAVKLLDGPLKDAQQRDLNYLLSLDVDRLLHTFRINAKLPSTAEPLGGWEDPTCELRGHFLGHYLSAASMMYRSTRDQRLKQRSDYLVAELAKCQQALGERGYLSAFPESFFDRLEKREAVWAPYYTIHKIMAGLLDAYQFTGNEQALDALKKMAGYFAQRNASRTPADMEQQVLHNEFGGMSEVLWNLYAITNDQQTAELAKKFDQEGFYEPLAHGVDNLTKLHANTHIPKVIAASRRYELTGEQRYHDVAEFFWSQVVDHRSYSTGGTSNHEHWRTEPDKLATELDFPTQESCCTYNMLKLTRHLFEWQPRAKLFDYYERAFFNSIIGSQDPDGMLMYFLPLKPGAYKFFGTPTKSFWCCTGTGIENWAKSPDSIYFHDDQGVFVNLFIPSEVYWEAKGVTIRQETLFPQSSRTKLTVKAANPVEFAIRIRIPYWAKGANITVNGKAVEDPCTPGSFATINRTWNDGDVVDVSLPMSLHVQPMPDAPDMVTIMYGPLVLAGALGKENLPPREKLYATDQWKYPLGAIEVPPLTCKADGNVLSLIKPAGPAQPPLTFTAVTATGPVTLVPLNQIIDQRFTVYWRVVREP